MYLSNNGRYKQTGLLLSKCRIERNQSKLQKRMTELVQSTKINYYQILGVSPDSTKKDICKAYRQIALKYHPTLQHPNKNQAYHIFCQASEAFDTLYDDQKRSIYDKYGDQVLKEGLIQNGQLIGKYKFTTNPQEVFEKFFGSNKVYDHLLDLKKTDSINHPIFASQYSDYHANKLVQPLIVPINCTLTELFNGCTKTISYAKKILSPDGQSAQQVMQTKTIEILPGSSSKQDIVFLKQGNREPGYPESDLIFKIIEISEKNFRRQDSSLIYLQRISLMDALDSKSMKIIELNGKVIDLHFDQIINPQTRRIIEGKGMPIKGNPNKRGDLIVTFDIQFPDELSLENKRQIVKLLKV